MPSGQTSYPPPAPYPSAGPDAGEGPDIGGKDIRYYLGVVLHYWWVILLALLIGTGIGVVRCYMAIPVYRATCRLEVVHESRLNFPGNTGYGGYRRIEEEMARYSLLLESRALNRQVRQDLSEKAEELLPEKSPSPKVSVAPVRSLGTTLDLRVDSGSTK